MESNPQQQPTPILEIAWTRFAQLDAISSRRTKKHLSMRRLIAGEPVENRRLSAELEIRASTAAPGATAPGSHQRAS